MPLSLEELPLDFVAPSGGRQRRVRVCQNHFGQVVGGRRSREGDEQEAEGANPAHLGDLGHASALPSGGVYLDPRHGLHLS